MDIFLHYEGLNFLISIDKTGDRMVRRITIALIICLSVGLPRPAFAGPALLIEASNGKVLYAENQDDQWHPASLTKIMTAYLAFKALKSGRLTLDSKLTCSVLAHREPPSKVGLPIGAKMSVRQGLNALIVKSANDVAIMFAEAISGTHDAFVEKMNRTARQLGMTRTHFDNPNGLPSDGQITTARDLAILSRRVLKEFPEYAELWKKRNFKLGRRRLGTHNGLLKTFKGADGLKTGFICDSGYNVVATATRDGRRLMAIVLGATSGGERRIRAASLLEHGFRTYDWKQLFNTTTIDNLPIDRFARGPVSIRKTVRNRACGYRGIRRKRRRNSKAVARARARKARKHRARAARVKKSKKGKKAARTVKSVKVKKSKKKS